VSFIPYAVSWNLTKSCNLACKHCYIDATVRGTGGDDELSTEETYKILEQIAGVNPGVVLILTGGEPLMRRDIYDICKKASSLGMMVVLGTNGTMITKEAVAKLKASGVSGIGISIDSLKAEVHDAFRGSPGSLAKGMEGLKLARDGGLEIQVQTSVSHENAEEIPLIAEWAHRLGARVFNLFFLVCTGRGETVTDISPEGYEKILKWSADNQGSFEGMMIRPKCAPHFKRILYQADKENPLLNTYIAACRAGTHYCRITPEGKVSPCPYMPDVAGDLKSDDFGKIWGSSEEFVRLRTPEYGGKCGICQYRLMCGGCRARAHATLGDIMAEDQWCVYEPLSEEEAIRNVDTESKFDSSATPTPLSDKWSDEAKEKMGKMPVFARAIVQKTVEKYADEKGINEITVEVMRTAAPAPGPFAKSIEEAKKSEPVTGELEWDDDARERVKNSPDFVRPGILKLMQKRGKERGQKRITSEFLTEIRNESMMLVTRRMKKLGFSELDMKSWDAAKEKFSKVPHKLSVIDRITGALKSREKPNEMILEKFGTYFEDDSEKIGWTKEARERLDKTPFFVRKKAKDFIENYAKEHGYKYITDTAVNEAMEKLPFAKMMKRS